MIHQRARYEFEESISLLDAHVSLLTACFSAEGIHVQAKVRQAAGCSFEPTCALHASTQAGLSVAPISKGFSNRRVDEDGIGIDRAIELPKAKCWAVAEDLQ